MNTSATDTPEARRRKYTKQQGQYLAFIHYYTKIHGCPPAESDMQRYFRVRVAALPEMSVGRRRSGPESPWAR